MKRKLMVKNAVLFLVLVMLLSMLLAGCGGKQSSSNVTAQQNSQEKENSYPTRPIEVIIPYAAGGGTDINARLVASYWQKKLGQPVVIVNKTGGGGAIGDREIAHAKPDGYSLGCLSYPDSPVLVAAKGAEAGFKNEDYILLGDFTRTPDVLAVKKGGLFKTLQEFIDYAKKNPGKITVSVPGDAHKLAVMLIEEEYGIDLNPVMFKSGGEAMNNLLGGHVMATVCASQFALPSLDKIEPLAITGEKRLDKIPKVPTFKELGHNIPIEMMRIFVAPQGVPEPILKKLRTTLMELGQNKEFIDKVNASGEVYGALFGSDLEKYYNDTNAKISSTVAKFKDQFAQ